MRKWIQRTLFTVTILIMQRAPADEVLKVPALEDAPPAPGKFVRQVAPEYQGTGVYHALYLPTDWSADRQRPWPVIVEYAGNQSPPVCTGRVEDCRMGYCLSGGVGYLWVVMPYVNPETKKNQLNWWGDAAVTRAYCRDNLRRICETYHGDTSAILLAGFSRGAIAGGFIGLGDEATADVWLGFLPFSHHDAGNFTKEGGRERLARMRGRASFITYGSHDGGRANSTLGAKILEELGNPVTLREVPDTAHTDRWISADSPLRAEMRRWMADVVRQKPGTHAVAGRVRDAQGRGLAGVRIAGGDLHWTDTDAEGRYRLSGLIDGPRTLRAVLAGKAWEPAERKIELRGADLEGVDFVGR